MYAPVQNATQHVDAVGDHKTDAAQQSREDERRDEEDAREDQHASVVPAQNRTTNVRHITRERHEHLRSRYVLSWSLLMVAFAKHSLMPLTASNRMYMQ